MIRVASFNSSARLGEKPGAKLKTLAVTAMMLPLSALAQAPANTQPAESTDRFEMSQSEVPQAQCPMLEIEARVLKILKEVRAAQRNNHPLSTEKIQEVITTLRTYFLSERKSPIDLRNESTVIDREIREARERGKPLTNDEINCRLEVLDLRLMAESPGIRDYISQYTQELEGLLRREGGE